jgi:hypothetical protein
VVEYLYGIRGFYIGSIEASYLIGCETITALLSYETSGATHTQRHIPKRLETSIDE